MRGHLSTLLISVVAGAICAGFAAPAGASGRAAIQAPQPSVAPPPVQPGQGRGGAGAAYPTRVVDAAMVERGRALYTAQCAFCHGADTRGASGPSLLRSQLVQDDQNGEMIGPVVRGGRAPMPAFDLSDTQLGDLAAFLHSFTLNSRDPARMRPINIVTGNAASGQSYFAQKCGSCHSAERDLKGIASRFPDPRALQQWWLMPGGSGRGGAPPGAAIAPTRATITLSSGEKYEGRLTRMDEFHISITEADGTTRTFRRNGDLPKIDINDPLVAHKALLRTYSDKDIHDVTAYLVTLK